MADEQDVPFSQEQLLKHLLTSSIRIEATLNVLSHMQASLTAKAYGTSFEEESKAMLEAIEEQKQLIVAQSVSNREPDHSKPKKPYTGF
jgi:bifunctional N-acetylglucosamine-1-phosphate-uridyltransferase/glucosamine-1-phosphate-acetyltransferase GlmU-like protein